jgi:AcrR family transcriptional regulator
LSDLQSNRAAILSAARELFYNEGIRAASMDAIAERAGVTKKTVYHHFRSKDDLVAAWLTALDAEVRLRYAISLGPIGRPFEERIHGLFARLAGLASDPRWKGCAFARAANELAGLPGHPGVAAAKAHRRRFEAWFEAELRVDGLADPARLARRLIILFDGAVTQSLLHHDPDYAVEAGEAAAAMVAAAREEALRQKRSEFHPPPGAVPCNTHPAHRAQTSTFEVANRDVTPVRVAR